SLDECIADTGIPNLSILPLGAATAQHTSKLSPTSLRRIIKAAREKYDTILIDTGPILGSLEASVVAAEVDGVILTVSRGEQRPLAERCVAHVVSIGARLAGIVFNRASSQDITVYGTMYRMSSLSSQSVRSQPMSVRTQEGTRFDPLAQSVAASG